MDWMKACRAAGLASVAALPATGRSADYVGIDIGLINKPDTAHFVIGNEAMTSDIPSNHEIDRGIVVGHQFNPYFALEAGYRDLGTLSGPLHAAPGYAPVQGNFQLTFKGPTLALLGTLPLGRRWEAYGKLGTMISRTHISLFATGDSGAASVNTSAWNAAAMGEVGVRFHITSAWDVGLAAGAFAHLGKKYETGTANLKTTNLTLRYHF
jgi:OOP family OmpA-OmpF porin